MASRFLLLIAASALGSAARAAATAKLATVATKHVPRAAVGGIQNTSTKSSAIRSLMRGFSKSRIDIWV